MDTRLATILASSDLGQSGTKIIDINITDIISRISVKFRAVNGSDGNIAHPAALITKLELVDGSDVLYSCNGHQAQAVNWYDRGKRPFSGIYNWDGAGNTVMCGLDFGRFLFDPVLAFDPTKFKNPQLKITYDERLVNADCTANTCEVFADIFDEKKPSPSGFMVTKDIYNYIVGTTGYQYIDLPVDRIIHQIYVKCIHSYYDFTDNIDAFRLSEDNDKRVPLEFDSYDLCERVFETYGYVEEHAKLYGTAAQVNFFGMPNTEAHAMGSCEGGLGYPAVWSHGGGTYGYIEDAATYRVRAKLIGILPHGTIPLLPKPGPELADWWDVTKIGSLQLRIEDSAPAATTPTAEVVISQYRPY